MLAELNQFRDPAEGKRQLEGILNRAGTGHGYHHPVLTWLASNPLPGPALIFDTDRIAQRMQWLGDIARPLSVTPLVAVKSCPEPEFLDLGHRYLDGFDVSNAAEYSCLPNDLKGQLVSVTAPDLDTDFGGFTSRGNNAVVTLDSLVQLNQYVSQNPPVPYLLRIQGSDLLKDRQPPDPAYFPSTRFGFSVAETERLLEHPPLRDNPPAGFHIHHGSERNQASTYRAIISGLSRLAEKLPSRLKFINLGGGWHAMSRSDILATIQAARDAFPLPCAILLEPGRWYAEDAGFALGTIVNQTQDNGIIKYTLNLSGKCHLHWSNVKLLHKINPGCGQACQVQFFGSSCFEADTIGRFLIPFSKDFHQESGLTPGKHVVFTNISTYSAAWNTSFNGIPKADVIWWKP